MNIKTKKFSTQNNQLRQNWSDLPGLIAELNEHTEELTQGGLRGRVDALALATLRGRVDALEVRSKRDF